MQRTAFILIVLLFGAAAGATRPVAPVTVALFAPDGKTIVAASQAGLALHHAPPSSPSAPATVLPSALPNVHDLAFSPNGKLLAVGGGAPAEWGRVELRAWPGGRVLGTLSGGTDVVTSVAFSPDGTLLAAGCADSAIRLYDVTSRKEVRTLSGHAGPVLSVSISPDGKWLASGSADRSIKLWEIASGRLVRTLNNHLGAVHTVAFRRQGRDLASASDDATVRIWQPEIGRLVRIVRGYDGPVLDLCFARDGDRLFSAGADGRVRLIAGDSDQILATFTGPTEWLNTVAVSPDGQLVAAGDTAGRLWVWRVADGRLLTALPP